MNLPAAKLDIPMSTPADARIKKILVLGGGSAGFIAAITLKTRLPELDIAVIRSKEIGIIGVGEGTFFKVPDFLHGYLKIPPTDFVREVRPIWKLGVRFLWGKRPYFDYSLEPQLFSKWTGLPKHNGFYCADDFTDVSFASAMMGRNRVFLRRPDGLPEIRPTVAYHLENQPFVAFLEAHATRVGVRIADDAVTSVEQSERGITALRLASGQTASADLYVDCSGFASVLLSRTLQQPFVSFRSSLFCDRAVVGGWNRQDEPIQPYTVAETMDSGWCWRIDLEERINRGYVYSSAFISDEEADREFRAKNPRVQTTRIVKYVSGRYQDGWVRNVVAIGNASGFVEPLEATSIAGICNDSHTVAELLANNEQLWPTNTQITLYNRRNAFNWECIRRFLAVHYKFNTRLQTPFWRECRETTDLAGAEEIVENYRENGPTPLFATTLLDQRDQFGIEGYLVMLMGQCVPYGRPYVPAVREAQLWSQIRAKVGREAANGVTVPEALRMIRSPGWAWPTGLYRY